MISLAAMLLCNLAYAYDDRIDDIMYQDPAFLDGTTRIEFPDGLKTIWFQALARPEAELQRMAADTIALAHRASMPGLEEAADRLIVLLQQDQLEPSVRRAAANALVTLDAKQAAKPFAASMTTGSLEILKIVEPALARWDYEPARTIWRQRLIDPEVERARLQLAIQCLGIVKDAEASSALLGIVKDVNAEVPVRLSAARASAEVNQIDVIAAANDLASAEADQPTASLLAATLLAGQVGPEAVSILQRLATVEAVTTSGLALRRLFEIDPTLVYSFSTAAIRSTDVNIRRVGCEALAHRADAESIRQLGPLLDDVNPGLRRDVSVSMLRLAEQAALRDVVIQTTTEIVSRDAWRGLEQGVIVLATLDHEPTAPRLVELLTHRRPEVAVSAAWGLRKLAVLDTLPAMFAQAEQQAKLVVEETFEPRYLESIDLQLSQLFQAFGERGYGEAESLMRKFIPKAVLYYGATRPAAVWAIGKLNEGTVDEALATLLAARLADVLSPLPEVGPVRRMSAVGIGRMKAESQLKTLRQFVVELPGLTGQACLWSLERMTGETQEFSVERVQSSADWFLTPYFVNRPSETD
ncbi:MAG: hypothetical protein ABI614_05365 [Planctomycetota bacterium]